METLRLESGICDRVSSASLVRLKENMFVTDRLDASSDTIVFVLRGGVRLDRYESSLPAGSFTFLPAGRETVCYPEPDCSLLLLTVDPPQSLCPGVFTAENHLLHYLKEMELYLSEGCMDEGLCRLKIREFFCLFKAFYQSAN